MKDCLVFFYVFFSILIVQAQQIERVEINGRISVDTEDKEGIVVYNQSANKGVTTDENGAFKIDVAVNDVVGFGALQFKDFIIIIDARIIESRQVSVRLVEDVNKLDEVLVLPYDLSGNINVDVNAVRTYNVDMAEIYEDEEDFDDYKFSADSQTKVDSPILNENRFVNGLNMVNIFRLFVNKKDKSQSKVEQILENRSPIIKRYNAAYLETHFNIPTDLTYAFIDFVEEATYDKMLLEKKNEILLLDYLRKQSELFLIIRK